MHIVETVQYAGTERYVEWLIAALLAQGVHCSIICRPDCSLHSNLTETEASRITGTVSTLLLQPDGEGRSVPQKMDGPMSSSGRGTRAGCQQNITCGIHAILKSGPLLAQVGHIRRTIKSEKPNVVHVHNGITMLSAVLATLGLPVRIVATQHFITPQSASYRGIKRFLARTAHHWVHGRICEFIAIAEAVKSTMLLRRDAPPGRITVVPNGIPAPDISKLSAVARVRSELSLSDSAPIIVCLARLEKEKDVLSLVRAMKLVRRELPSAVCLVAGEGEQHAILAREIAALGVGDSVRLLGFRSDALSLVRASDLFVLPSVCEPFGLAILEAMALSKPVIATRAGGPLEIIQEGVTGLLVPPSCPSELATAIVRLLSNPELANAMGDAGRKRYESCFTADRMAAGIVDVYRRAIGSFGT